RRAHRVAAAGQQQEQEGQAGRSLAGHRSGLRSRGLDQSDISNWRLRSEIHAQDRDHGPTIPLGPAIGLPFIPPLRVLRVSGWDEPGIVMILLIWARFSFTLASATSCSSAFLFQVLLGQRFVTHSK